VHAATQINAALLQHFTELPEFVEAAQEDTDTLVSLTDAKAKHEATEAELSYAVHIGIAKELLSINSEEIVWQGQHFPTQSIERIRWGATKHSVNGIPTGTTHTIVFGSSSRGTQITTRNENVYAEFTSRLWRVVGIRLAAELLGRLAAGETIVIGGIHFNDTGVALASTKLFGTHDVKSYNWNDVKIYSQSGKFIVVDKSNSWISAQASYQDHDNTHVLSNILHAAFRNGCVRLSEMLN